MSEEVILQFMAQDDISPVIQTLQSNVVSAMEQIQSAISNMGTGFDNAQVSVNTFGNAENVVIGSAKEATNVINNESKSVKDNTSGVKSNTSAKKEGTTATNSLTNSTNKSKEAMLGHTNIANMSAGSLMYLSGQLTTLGSKAEDAARSLNETKISMDQVAKMAGVSEEEMSNMITTMSNETFSNDEAVMYTKNLTQMGVAAENFVEQATNIDRINDAFGLGAETTNSLVTELSVLGVDMNDVASSFNALAYANENTKGGMENFYTFLRKYDAELHDLGYNVDQSAIIISAATQKFGGGRAALTGLSNALKDAGGDANALEAALGLQTGALAHASEETATYEGQLQNLADEEMEHKTILERVGAWWDDIALQNAGLISGLESLGGAFGQVGSMALYTKSILELGFAFSTLAGANGPISNTLARLNAFNIAKKGGDASDALGGVGKGANTVGKETKDVVKGAKTVGSLAPEAEAGAVGATATGGALSGIASAFTSMIVPLLAIAAVIAVMLPIMAGLAAEALLLLKGLQVLVKALGFDKIDLSKSIEGIKQIGHALLEIGIAMAELTFASIITASTNIVNGVLGLINPVETASKSLLQAAEALKAFNNVKINKEIPEKIKSISETLKLVSDAMGDLVNLSLSMAWGNLVGQVFGTIKDAVQNARKDIVDAANEIDKIKDVPDLDKGATDRLKKIGTALDGVGKAFDGLRKIRDGYNWDNAMGEVFKGIDIEKAIENVKTDLSKAASAIKNIQLDDVDDKVGGKIQRVASALEGIGKSIESLRKIRDNYNWDNSIGQIFKGVDIQSAFDSIKEDLLKVSTSLKGLENSVDKGGLGDISEDLPKKINNVNNALESVLNAVDAMNNFKGKGEGEKSDDFSGVTKTITNAKDSLVAVSKALQSLGNSSDNGDSNGLATIGEDVGAKIDSMKHTLDKVADSINGIVGLPTVNSADIKTKIQEIAKSIGIVTDEINNLGNHERIHDGIYTTVVKTGTSARVVGNTARVINGLPNIASGTIKGRIEQAVKAIATVTDEINKLSGHERIKDGIYTTVVKTGTSARVVGNTARVINGLPNVNDGTVTNRIKKAVKAVKNVAKEINKIGGGDRVNDVSAILNSIRTAVNDLKKTLSASAGSFKTAGHNISEGLKDGINSGLNGLDSVVIQRVQDAMNAAKPTATTYGKGLGSSAVNGFKSTFLLADVISAELSASATAIANGTPDLVNAMGQLASQMVSSFKANAEISSPGAIARSIRDEMIYGREFVVSHGRGVIDNVGNLARGMVANFNPNLQNALREVTERLGFSNFSRTQLNTLRSLRENASGNTNNNNNNVTIVISEGAIQMDARSLTTKESRQVMVNAIEGLDVIEGVNVRGV